MTAQDILHYAFGKGAITYGPTDITRNPEAQVVIGFVCTTFVHAQLFFFPPQTFLAS